MILPALPLAHAGRAARSWDEASCIYLGFLAFFVASVLCIWFGPGRKEVVERIGWASLFLLTVLAACFLYVEGRRAATLGREIEDKVNDSLRQIGEVEQKWMLEHSKASNDMPSIGEYDLIRADYMFFVRDQTIYDRRSGVSTVVPETNLVYCLCYGMSNSPLPSDFMGGFTNPTPRVITGTNTLVFKNDGSILERETGRPVVVLALRALVITGDRADSSIRYINGGMVIAQMYRLIKKDGQWNYDGAFSTQTPALSRWGPTFPP
jgi:hypothetical protein